jgi:hypothetical protein
VDTDGVTLVALLPSRPRCQQLPLAAVAAAAPTTGTEEAEGTANDGHGYDDDDFQ